MVVIGADESEDASRERQKGSKRVLWHGKKEATLTISSEFILDVNAVVCCVLLCYAIVHSYRIVIGRCFTTHSPSFPGRNWQNKRDACMPTHSDENPLSLSPRQTRQKLLSFRRARTMKTTTTEVPIVESAEYSQPRRSCVPIFLNDCFFSITIWLRVRLRFHIWLFDIASKRHPVPHSLSSGNYRL